MNRAGSCIDQDQRLERYLSSAAFTARRAASRHRARYDMNVHPQSQKLRIASRRCDDGEGMARRPGRRVFKPSKCPRRENQDRAGCRDRDPAKPGRDALLQVRLQGRHVRLLRDGRERTPALDLPHAGRSTGGGNDQGSSRCANLPIVKDLAVDMAPFLREMAQRARLFRTWRTIRRKISPSLRQTRPSVQARRTPVSNASTAGSVIRPVTWWRGTRIISALPRSIAPGTLVNDVRDRGQDERLEAVSRRRRMSFVPQPI